MNEKQCIPISGLNARVGDWTEWSGKPVAESLNDCSGYAVAVIVRTQGIRQPLLKEALTSVSVQSNPCLAVVVVHAGAEILERVESVCREIPSLSWVMIHAERIENKRGYPLNIGLQHACALLNDVEAVAFLDDDDILYPDFSARMIQALGETGADVICAASNRSVPGQAVEEGYRPIPFLNLFVLNFIPINSYIIRLATLAKTPVFFDETLDVVEDWHYLLQLLQNGFRFEAIMDVLSEFRVISDGNKKIKDNPEKWENAYRYIHAFIQDGSFLINGQMIRRMMTDQNIKAAENQENLNAMQMRLEELESRLLEKTDQVIALLEKNDA
ncbi:MAG: glycosyltransferase [Deltaproteobacteria bacterium]|nr:glycosyltransferase [Deltaproteobacteria bacterium]